MATASDRQRATQWFRPGYPDQHMRVSDADRSDVTDRLARHYGDGRLDQAEFDDRVDRAMTAKTVADFQGLFDDLPDLPPELSDTAGQAAGAPSPAAGCMTTRRQRGGNPLLGKLLLVALFFICVSVAWHAVTDWWFQPWMIAAIVIVVAASRARRRSR
jgi:Domain of unknown function (DUF1707)